MDILVVASTVPAHADDAVPRFVLDQALSLAEAAPDLHVRILAPHTPSSRSLEWPRDESADGRVTQHRFGYAPRKLETLTARGIMPAIRANPAMAVVIPLLVWGERSALHREVRRQRPDVIYAHWFTPQAIRILTTEDLAPLAAPAPVPAPELPVQAPSEEARPWTPQNVPAPAYTLKSTVKQRQARPISDEDYDAAQERAARWGSLRADDAPAASTSGVTAANLDEQHVDGTGHAALEPAANTGALDAILARRRRASA